MNKQVVRAAALAAVVLVAGASAQAALVKYRMTGVVTQGGEFDDGSRVVEGMPVTVSVTYDSKQTASEMQRNSDGSGNAVYDFAGPYHFKMRVGDHRVHVPQFRVRLFNDLNQPFGDEVDVEASNGAYIDGVLQPDGRYSVSLLSQPGNLGALKSLRLPKHLQESSFDAFRVGYLAKDIDHPLVTFAVWSIKSTVCDAVPGTDDCAGQ
ncbi:MAG: hypothetical protein U1F53_19505 [Burkholderiaceae bacterium]